MASNILFEVDASKIIAKLHLAGLQPLSFSKDEFIVNTGIKNDDPKAKPDKPGNVEFDLDNSSGQYEVGYVRYMSYHKSFGLQQALNTASEIAAKLVGKSSSISDKDKDQEELYKGLEDAQKQLANQLGLKPNDKLIETITEKSSMDELKKLIEKREKEDADNYSQMIAKATEEAYKKFLLPYMQNFAGASNVKMASTDVVAIPISEKVKDSNSKELVSDFQIVPMPDVEQKKMEAQFRVNAKKDGSNSKVDNCKHKMCFMVKYDLTVDK